MLYLRRLLEIVRGNPEKSAANKLGGKASPASAAEAAANPPAASPLPSSTAASDSKSKSPTPISSKDQGINSEMQNKLQDLYRQWGATESTDFNKAFFKARNAILEANRNGVVIDMSNITISDPPNAQAVIKYFEAIAEAPTKAPEQLVVSSKGPLPPPPAKVAAAPLLVPVRKPAAPGAAAKAPRRLPDPPGSAAKPAVIMGKNGPPPPPPVREGAPNNPAARGVPRGGKSAVVSSAAVPRRLPDPPGSAAKPAAIMGKNGPPPPPPPREGAPNNPAARGAPPGVFPAFKAAAAKTAAEVHQNQNKGPTGAASLADPTVINKQGGGRPPNKP